MCQIFAIYDQMAPHADHIMLGSDGNTVGISIKIFTLRKLDGPRGANYHTMITAPEEDESRDDCDS